MECHHTISGRNKSDSTWGGARGDRRQHCARDEGVDRRVVPGSHRYRVYVGGVADGGGRGGTPARIRRLHVVCVRRERRALCLRRCGEDWNQAGLSIVAGAGVQRVRILRVGHFACVRARRSDQGLLGGRNAQVERVARGD